jgi:hypothetical protein
MLLSWHFTKIFRVDKMSSTKLFGHFELLGVEINGNDFCGTSMLGTLNDCQALYQEHYWK